MEFQEFLHVSCCWFLLEWREVGKLELVKLRDCALLINSLLMVSNSMPYFLHHLQSWVLSFCLFQCALLLWPGRWWSTDNSSQFVLQQDISAIRRLIYLSAFVHRFGEDKWPSSGLMPISSAAFTDGGSKLYITALCAGLKQAKRARLGKWTRAAY